MIVDEKITNNNEQGKVQDVQIIINTEEYPKNL